MSHGRFGNGRMAFGAVVVVVVTALGCARGPVMPGRFAAPATTHRHADGALISHEVHQSTDPREFAAFVLTEIPSLLDKVECRCCHNNVGRCLREACPRLCPTCIGLARKAYDLHLQGLTDDDVVRRLNELPVGA